MNEENIIYEYAENYKRVSAEDFEKITGYSISNTDALKAACAAVITILNHLKEEN